MHRFGSLSLGCAAALSAVLLASNDARACGGCFHGEPVPGMTENTVVTGHRMALSISPVQTILWDQIEYAGNPSDFAWVLPVKAGARLELGSDAWFEALETVTAARVLSPDILCSGNNGSVNGPSYTPYYGYGSRGCSSGCGPIPQPDPPGAAMDGSGATGGDFQSPPPPPVTVVHQDTVGPYEVVTLHADKQGVLTDWLLEHGYKIDDDIAPIIDDYTAEGFDFIALRLQPGQGVQQMTPVRVVSPGAEPTLPLRMVAAGTGANVALTLFVIGEGRWETQNFTNEIVNPGTLVWDFASSSSNYAEERKALLAKNEGRTWLDVYAQPRVLFQPRSGRRSGPSGSIEYQSADGTTVTTIAELYARQGLANGETTTIDACLSAFNSFGWSDEVVVDPCQADEGGSGGGGGGVSECGDVGAGQIDARAFACGELDDLSSALVGLHPSDVWVTRLDANLPRAALASDLTLQAAGDQSSIDNWIKAQDFVNPPCEVVGAGVVSDASARRPPPSNMNPQTTALALLFAAMGLTLARRAARPTLIPVRR